MPKRAFGDGGGVFAATLWSNNTLLLQIAVWQGLHPLFVTMPHALQGQCVQASVRVETHLRQKGFQSIKEAVYCFGSAIRRLLTCPDVQIPSLEMPLLAVVFGNPCFPTAVDVVKVLLTQIVHVPRCFSIWLHQAHIGEVEAVHTLFDLHHAQRSVAEGAGCHVPEHVFFLPFRQRRRAAWRRVGGC